MKQRKLIGVVILNPEGIYQQRVMEGILSRCKQYDYDVAVFATLVQACHFYPAFLEGELHIFDLMNYDLLDGIIVVTMSLCEDNVTFVQERLEEKFKRECPLPVVSIDIPFADYHTILTDDSLALEKVTNHVIDDHHCEKIYYLNGTPGHPVSMNRMEGFCRAMEAHGRIIDEKYIFSGDFWYGSGEALAERIANGELEMPDAVICASDHMAIGLANRLIENGINIPEQVIVTGFDATAEALINEPTITTYIPDVGNTAVAAVDYLHDKLEKDRKDLPPVEFEQSGICTCKSCGCPENTTYIKQRVGEYLYRAKHNLGAKEQVMDISRLLESYTSEYLTEAETPDDCMERICRCTYLVEPFKNLYLCLNNTWLNDMDSDGKGFTDRMKIVVQAIPEHAKRVQLPTDESTSHASNTYAVQFDTKQMLPMIFEEREEPDVFYFTGIHFNEKVMGYAVLQSSLTEKHMISFVYRNWMRYVNNALENVRIHNSLSNFSKLDPMTALYNRRGMEEWMHSALEHCKENEKVLAIVIDMDGLKQINDTYGHGEGDTGILFVASAVRKLAKTEEIAVRAGGDEFYLLGVGEYQEEDIEKRLSMFSDKVSQEGQKLKKGYELSASVGYALGKAKSKEDIMELLEKADKQMYDNKSAAKKNRMD